MRKFITYFLSFVAVGLFLYPNISYASSTWSPTSLNFTGNTGSTVTWVITCDPVDHITSNGAWNTIPGMTRSLISGGVSVQYTGIPTTAGTYTQNLKCYDPSFSITNGTATFTVSDPPPTGGGSNQAVLLGGLVTGHTAQIGTEIAHGMESILLIFAGMIGLTMLVNYVVRYIGKK